MTDESDGSGGESDASSGVLPDGTTAQEAFSGRVVGVGTGVVPCDECGRELRDGQSVVVYSYRLTNPDWWALARCSCEDCAPDTVISPRLGADEVLVEATLRHRSFPTTGRRRLSLDDVEIRVYSPPTAGDFR
ncbi:MAG: hypothetical protein ACOCSF_04330 [Halanaeroarchaeum sp.]